MIGCYIGIFGSTLNINLSAMDGLSFGAWSKRKVIGITLLYGKKALLLTCCHTNHSVNVLSYLVGYAIPRITGYEACNFYHHRIVCPT